MMKVEKIYVDFILFDMIGTTVQDTKQGSSIILESFQKAFANHNIEVSRERINRIRGKSKLIAIKELLEETNCKEDLADKIYTEFLELLQDSISSFQEIPNASDIFKSLNEAGIKIGIGSGLPRKFMDSLIIHLGWDISQFDFICSSEDLEHGRPNPIMIQKAMKDLAIFDKSKVLKVGDTIIDVLEGRNANVITVMVTSGSQTVSDLGDIRPDFILSSIRDLQEIMKRM